MLVTNISETGIKCTYVHGSGVHWPKVGFALFFERGYKKLPRSEYYKIAFLLSSSIEYCDQLNKSKQVSYEIYRKKHIDQK